MRLQVRFLVLVMAAAAGTLEAQQEIGVSFGLAGEWNTIPGRVDVSGVARGGWGGSATLELWYAKMPRFALLTRLGYAPERLAPAGPRMTTLGGGVRLTLFGTQHLSVRTSLEVEAVRFAAEAYNSAVAYCPPGYGCAQVFRGYWEGWRAGMSLRPALQVWPTDAVGFQITPAVRWLAPFGQGGPAGNPLYMTLGAGMVFKLRQ